MDQKYGVSVHESKIPGAGMGLFADKDFKKNQVIMPYTGEYLTLKQKIKRYPKNDAKYLFQLSDNVFIDAVDPKKSSLARYANHKPARFANAKLTSKGNITAIKVIKSGSEIFVNYGRSFRLPKAR